MPCYTAGFRNDGIGVRRCRNTDACRMCNGTENPAALIRFPLEEKGLLADDREPSSRGGKPNASIRYAAVKTRRKNTPAFFLLFLDRRKTREFRYRVKN